MSNDDSLEATVAGAVDESFFVNGVLCKPCGLPYQNITDIYTCPDHRTNCIHYGCGSRDGTYCVVNGCGKQIIPLIPQQTGESLSLGVKKTLQQKSTGVSVIEFIQFNNLIIESRAYNDYGGLKKQLFTFDKSLERIRTAGFLRHLLPCEFFAFVYEGLEGKLTDIGQEVQKNMLESYGEWLSMAFWRVGNTLHCYEHPENLVRVGSEYDASRMTHSGEKTFSLKKGFLHSALPSREFIPLRDVASVCPDLVQYLWSREMSQLPSDIKTRAGLWLHEEGIVWPVGRQFYDYDVNGYVYGSRASRGVVAAQKIS